MPNHRLDHQGVGLVLGLFGAFATGFAMTQSSSPWLFWIGILLCYGTAFVTFGRYRGDLSVLWQTLSIRLVDLTLFVVIIALILEVLIPTYLIIERYSSASAISIKSATAGAIVQIDPEEPEKLKDGTYYLPIDIYNIGDSDIDGYVIQFGQDLKPIIFDQKKEDEYMKHMEGELMKIIGKNLNAIKGSGSNLSAYSALKLRETRKKITEEELGKILSGDLIVYYGVIMIYSDKTSNTLYFAERCAHYDANIRDFVDCAGHNFKKNTSLSH